MTDVPPLVVGVAGRVRFVPLLSGNPYDPAGQGGAVLRLQAWRTPDRSGVPVIDVGPALRVAFGEYDFEVPAQAEAGLLYDRVTFDATNTGPRVTVDGTTQVFAISGETDPTGALDPWVAADDVLPATLDLAVRKRAAQFASEVLWALSGRRFGLQTVTVRPSMPSGLEYTLLGTGYATGSFQPLLTGGTWLNTACACSNGCSHLEGKAVVLAGRVDAVEQVVLDGQVLDPTAYRVDNRRELVRQDGHLWPIRQDLSLPAGQPGTFQVTYRLGAPVPTGGAIAAQLMAAEVAKALVNDPSCRLPPRAQSVARQGVTIVTGDQQGYLDKGRTGIAEVDLWLTSVNPHKRSDRSRVWSPDTARPRRTTTA